MLAWKIDTKLSILVKTSSKLLSQLIFATFAQNHYVINDHLLMTRIQTVNVEGTPQDYEQIMTHSKHQLVRRCSELISIEDWEQHLDDIRVLGVLANQASEFEYKRNLTEGKTGIVQPDLISSKNIEESLNRKPSISPKNSIVSMEKMDDKLRELKQELKKQNDTSNLPNMFYDSTKLEEATTPDSPKFPVSPSKSANQAKKSKVSNVSESPKFPLTSPAKKSFFSPKKNAHLTSKTADITLPDVNNVIKNNTVVVAETQKAIADMKLVLTVEDPVKLIKDKVATDFTNKSVGAKAESAKMIDSEKSNSFLKESNVKVGDGSEESSITGVKSAAESDKVVAGSDKTKTTSTVSDISKEITGTEADKKKDESIIKTTNGTDEKTKSKEFTVTAVKDTENNEPTLKDAEKSKESAKVTEITSDTDKKTEVKQPNLKEIGKISSVKDTDAVDAAKESILKEVSNDVKSREPNLKDSTQSFIANEQKMAVTQEVPKKVEEPAKVTNTVEIPKIADVTKTVEATKPTDVKKLEEPEKLKEISKIEQEEQKVPENIKTEPASAIKPAPEAPPTSTETKPTLQRSRKKLMEAKPPNVLVYSDSTTTRSNVIKTLGGILKESMYTIYPLTIQQVRERIWLDNTTLLVVCGAINGSDISQIFLEYFFKGGKVLCLCSDLLRQVLPTYHTAEVKLD